MFVRISDSSDCDRYGDEYRIWEVYLADDDGEPIDEKYETCYSEDAAFNVAEQIARTRGNLEIVID